nr:SafA/ExsA family spore coat assembly protein [Mesobacillus harenae]
MHRREIRVKIHIVQKGDTLWKIAKKYGVNFEELKKLNSQLSNPDMIMPGMKIKVPTTGGTIKKESPQTGPGAQAKINMGTKKEMPVKEHPKEQPKPTPEMKVPKEVPKAEVPKEVPKKPYKPKMPQPVIPEIDINNYYTLNMANMSVQQPPKQQPLQPKPQPKSQPKHVMPEEKQLPQTPQLKQPKTKPLEQPKMQPQLPLKPDNLFPDIKPDIKLDNNQFTEEESSPLVPIHQGGHHQSMIPYPQNNYPVYPGMQGTGYPNQQMMNQPNFQNHSQMPQHPMPGYQGMSPEVDNAYFDQPGMESSGFTPNMPAMPQMHGNMDYQMPYYQMPHQMPPQVQGMSDYQMPPQVQGMSDYQMPPQVQGMSDYQMPPQVQGAQTAPGMEIPCYPEDLMPMSPVMPGPGYPCTPYTIMPHQMPPQVQGITDYQMPHQMPPQVQGMTDYQMPHQMPPQVQGMTDYQMPHQMPPQVQGMTDYQMPHQMPPQVQGMTDYQMPHQMPPQVQGMTDYQMPHQMPPQVQGMTDYQMPHQMPPQVQGMTDYQMPHQMPPQVQGAFDPYGMPGMQQAPMHGYMPYDCGCGGGGMMPYGPSPGAAPYYGTPYDQQQIAPYNYGPPQDSIGMPRVDDESNDY